MPQVDPGSPESKPPKRTAAPLTPWSLEFRDPRLERAYLEKEGSEEVWVKVRNGNLVLVAFFMFVASPVIYASTENEVAALCFALDAVWIALAMAATSVVRRHTAHWRSTALVSSVGLMALDVCFVWSFKEPQLQLMAMMLSAQWTGNSVLTSHADHVYHSAVIRNKLAVCAVAVAVVEMYIISTDVLIGARIMAGFFFLAKIRYSLRAHNERERILRQEFAALAKTSASLEMSESRASNVEKENEQLKATLKEAQKTVDRVMSGGGTVLDAMVRRIRVHEIDIMQDCVLGEGSFGTVYKGTWRDSRDGTERVVAVKTVRTSRVSEKCIKEFKDEITIMAPLQHENLVNLLGACWEDGPDHLFLVLEFCAAGSVDDMLKDETLTWATTYYDVSVGTARCFKYLHHEQPTGEPLIHRDLKPANVLVTEDLRPKVADFGGSRRWDSSIANESDAATMTMVGTPIYCAPEVLMGLPYNESIDVFSFGIYLLELVCGSGVVKTQFNAVGRRTPQVFGWRPSVPAVVQQKQPGLGALITQCWEMEPSARPSFEQVLERLDSLAKPDAESNRKTF